MKTLVSDEINTVLGIRSMSDIIYASIKAAFEKTPELADLLADARRSGEHKAFSLKDFDVENAGDEDGFDTDMIEGFQGLEEIGDD